MASSSDNTEETPLLRHERFGLAQKRAVVAIASFTGLLPTFVSGSFVPLIPQIAKDLKATPEAVGFAVSISIFAYCLGALTGATYSSYYGRRPIYIASGLLLTIGSLFLSLAHTIPELMFWRFLQVLATSPGLVVGSGVIGDIYESKERGKALGTFYSITLFGPAFAPLTGGYIAHHFSWRIVQLFVAFLGVLSLLFSLVLLPETYPMGERGIDKAENGRLWRPVALNPLRSFGLLRSRNLLAVTMAGFAFFLADYVLLVPVAYTIGKKYDIVDETLIGACFLPNGIGHIFGAPLSGILSDKLALRWRDKRGSWRPEDRLRVAAVGAVLVPMSLIGSASLLIYVPGKVGLLLNLILFFLNGLGVDFILSPCAAYVVDIFSSTGSAEAMAADNGFRSIVLSIAVAGIIPSVKNAGVVVTNSCTALVVISGAGLLWLVVRNGAQWREFDGTRLTE